MRTAPRSVAAEKFRRLKTTLVHLPEPPQLIVVTSGAPAEGKSTISLNLALALASAESRTLLIDADLRRPTIEKYLDPSPGVGLTEVLQGDAELRHAVLDIEDSDLRVLPAGEPAAEPLGLLSSPATRRLLDALRRDYDHVVIDTPPVLPFTDAAQVAASADGVLLVARSRITPESVLVQAVESLSAVRLLGVVLNDAVSGVTDGQHYYDRYYHDYYSQDRVSHDPADRDRGEPGEGRE